MRTEGRGSNKWLLGNEASLGDEKSILWEYDSFTVLYYTPNQWIIHSSPEEQTEKYNQIKVNAKSLEDSPVDQVFAVQAWEPSFGPLTPA